MKNRFSEIFIRRPVATTLLTIGIVLAGLLGYRQLPVAPLPQIDFPIVSVQANMPGASPDTMATSVAAPLERHLGQVADVNEMTSQSTQGSTRITLQFGLDRDIDGAARDVQAAIVAARADLPTSLRQNPSYHKVNPADAPIMVLAMTSSAHTAGQLYDIASNVLQQRLSQLPGVGEVDVSGSALPAVRVEINPTAVFRYGIGLEDIRAALASANANSPKGAIEDGETHYQIYANDQATKAAQYRDLVIAYRNNAPVKLSDVAEVVDSVEDLRNAGLVDGKPGVAVIVSRQPGANIIDVVDAVKAELPRLIASLPGDVDLTVAVDRSTTIRQSLADTQKTLIVAVVSGDPGRVRLPAQRAGCGDPERRGADLDHRHVRRDVSRRLQSRQPVADGADDLDRLRRRRRDRRPRERLAASRSGHAAARGGDPRGQRGRLHGPVDLAVADRGIRAADLFRRHRRTVVQRVRADPDRRRADLPRRLADDDADDVRADPAARSHAPPWPPLSGLGARLRRGARLLSRHAPRGAPPSGAGGGDAAGHGLAQLRPLPLPHQLRTVSGPGHGTDHRRDPGRPEHLVPGDEGEVHRTADDRAGGPGGRPCRRLHRRAADELRLHLLVLEALRRAAGHCGRRGQPAARQALPGGRRAPLHDRGIGPQDRRPAKQRDLPVYAALRRHGGALQMGARSSPKR